MSAAFFALSPWLAMPIIMILSLCAFNLSLAPFSPKPIDHDEDDFDDDSDWPRRLLHVPTMTSYKWSPGNIYGGFRNPSYVAISYTWGKFELRDPELKPHVKALPIRGVPWSIPRIDPEEHFTVDEFRRAICQTMGITNRHYEFDHLRSPRALEKTPASWLIRPLLRFLERRQRAYQFLWLDVACIEQRDSPVKWAEIGRQARIFQRAEHVYVWLSHLSHAEMTRILSDFAVAGSGLDMEPYTLSYEVHQWVVVATRALKELTQDPWFKSLWTLQEGYLRHKAILLSRESRVCAEGRQIGWRSMELNDILLRANNILVWSGMTRKPLDTPSLSELMNLLHTSGLGALWHNNPMGLLAISSNRGPRDPLDRVYGIMQILGPSFRVGRAADPTSTRDYTLDELQDEFASTIMRLYPVLSQMFVHLDPPAPGKSWCLQSSSVVPWILDRGDMFGWTSGGRLDVNTTIRHSTLCQLSSEKKGDHLWAHLSGEACSFKALQSAWHGTNRSKYAEKLKQSMWRMHVNSQNSAHLLALDRGTHLDPLPPQLDKVNVSNLGDENNHDELAAWVAQRCEKIPLTVLLMGRCDVGDESFNTGLILVESDCLGVPHWRRVGVCIWLHSHLSEGKDVRSMWELLRGDSPDWNHLEGRFG